MTDTAVHLSALPDVAMQGLADLPSGLDRVGMSGIDLPLGWRNGEGVVVATSAKAELTVNLRRADQRGIHMSRLYLALERQLAGQVVDGGRVAALFGDCLSSHRELSDRVRLVLRFDALLRRPALASGHAGWKAYPVELLAEQDAAGLRIDLAVQVAYSSTCPCSAALSLQLRAQRFAEDFPQDAPLDPARVRAWLADGRGLVATPHAQRSDARVRVRLREGGDLPIETLVDRVEAALGTPVQTAVKREDEQAFARLNAENLMFCEDAARRLQCSLSTWPACERYEIEVAHRESLHAHDAVARVAGTTAAS
jgi:GTP cyclohydrolase I